MSQDHKEPNLPNPSNEASNQELLDKVKNMHMAKDAGVLSSPAESVQPKATEAPTQKMQSMAPEQPAPRRGRSVEDDFLDLLRNLRSQHVYHPITLPSKGVFYKDDQVLSSGKLNVRAMTAKEEKILTSQRIIKSGKALDRIFKECIQENIDPETLLSVDRVYLLVFIRGHSHGQDYTADVRCPACGTKFSKTFNLNELEVTDIPEHLTGEPISDVMPNSGLRFQYRFMRATDDEIINKYREKRRKKFGDDAVDDAIVKRLSQVIESIEGFSDKAKIETIIEELQPKDTAYLRNRIMNPPFGIDTDVNIDCMNCMHEWNQELPFDVNFFFPQLPKE